MSEKAPLTITLALEQTRANLDHDEQLVREMAEILVADVPTMCQQLADSFRQAGQSLVDSSRGTRDGACESVAAQRRSMAHAIRGLASMFGAQPLTEWMQAIEQQPLEWQGDPATAAADIVQLGQATADALSSALRLAD